jgi:hypothetical protein
MKKNIFQWVVFFALYLNFKGLLLGQIFNFQPMPNAANETIVTAESNYGCGLSTFDFDEDGWEDLTLTSLGYPTRVYKNILGTYTLMYQLECGNNSKACLWGDVDEDGDNDLFIVGYLCPSKLYIQQPNGSFIDETSSQLPNFPDNKNLIGANFQDLNRDGFLDLIVYNWSPDSGNEVWLNHAGAFFSPMNLAPLTNFAKSSFQGSFTDANDDSFADLFVANDHFNGNDFLHFNLESQNINLSLSNTLSIPGNSMSASWGDFDNDLDEDIYISNGKPFDDHLAINQGDFNFESLSMGANEQDGWCASWADVNNDGWLDLFVSSVLENVVDSSTSPIQHNRFYRNESGTLQSVPSDQLPNFASGSYTHAFTDFDHDGRLDLLIANHGVNELLILHNENSEDHHFVSLQFQGRWSNRNAIGTKYNFYSPSKNFEGYLRSGENFMVQNGQHAHIGMGASTDFDSLVVYWPSGLKETFIDLIIDQNNIIVEGASLQLISIDSVNCQNQQIVLSTYAFPNFQWSNGSLEPTTQFNFNDEVLLTSHFEYGHIVAQPFDIPNYGTANFDYWLNAPSCETSNNGNLYFSYLYQPTQEIQTAYMDNLMVGDTSIVFEYDEGCYHIEHLTIEAISHFTLDSIEVLPSCPDLSTGEILAHTSHGYFNPSIENHTFLFDSLMVGNISVTLSDEAGCEITIDTLIPSFGTIAITTESPTCPDAENGWILFEFQSEMDSTLNQSQILDSLITGHYAGIFNYANTCQSPYEIDLAPQEVIQISLELPSEICSEDSLLFLPEWNPNLTWTSPLQPNQWISEPGLYPISAISELGCSWDSLLEISVAPIPIFQIDFDDNLIIIEPISFSPEYYNCTWPDGSIGWAHSFINDDQLTISISSITFGCQWDTTFILTGLGESTPTNPWRQLGNQMQYTGKKQGYCIVYNSLGQEIRNIAPFNNGQIIDLPLGEMCILRTPDQTIKVVNH